jgi:hypothetical protein
MDLSIIERKTKSFSAARGELVDLLTELNRDIENLKNSRLKEIKAAVSKTAEKRGELATAIEDGRQLFDDPRTVIFHGVKVGMTKERGGVVVINPNNTVKLIEKLFPDKADVLIKTTKKPLKKALGQLTVVDLKKIGCEVGQTGDVVVISAVDSEVEKTVSKMLAALIDDGTEEEEAE